MSTARNIATIHGIATRMAGPRLTAESRYTCSHDSHPDPPSFATWSALQAHMREAHAPTCPYRECHGRHFKSAHRLRDHLKVHAEREADMEVDLATQVVDDDVPDVILDGMPGRRKRRRKSEASKEDSALSKLRRLNDGSAGKRWTCEHEGCERAFKTVCRDCFSPTLCQGRA